jgi:hypothetical protein
MVDARPPQKDSDASQSSLACPSSHISPPYHAATLSASESGTAVRLQPINIPNSPGFHHDRGPITGFSKSSRLRLFWLLAQLGVDCFKEALFLTLTYPKGDSNAPQNKRHLDSFIKRLKRQFPSAAALWKLEYTAAGTPHFHALLFGIPFWSHQKVAQSWAQVVRSEHPDHHRAGTRIEKLLNRRKAIFYLNKYLAKPSTCPPEHHGRVWGKTANLNSFFSQVTHYLLSKNQVATIRRSLDLIRQGQNRRRTFRRATNLTHAQRWFVRGDTIARLLAYLNIKPLAILAPT